MKQDDHLLPGALTCCVAAVLFLSGLIHLGVKLWEVQVLDAPKYSGQSDRQSVRNVKTEGPRGCILDRHGVILAGNRPSLSICCNPAVGRHRSVLATVKGLVTEIDRVAAVIGRTSPVGYAAVSNHVAQIERSLPLVVWRDIGEAELARFSEHSREFPAFFIVASERRVYPNGKVAAHLLGYVGRNRDVREPGYRFVMPEWRGRDGLERYYDSYLRGVPGERRLLVDANSYTIREWTVVEARRGPDLRLSIDLELQREVERQLAGERGACVVIDPRNGEVLAFASAPGYDPNECVPFLSRSTDRRLAEDPAKPRLNRASAGTYAPGSTFKPVIALAALSAGVPAEAGYDCTGLYEFGQMRLHCTARWGHGAIDLRRALMKSCNPFFCNLAMDIGTNAVCTAARALGLGTSTGIDFVSDYPGVVPDASWKMNRFGERWYAGDLVQMAIGQGLLLVTPLQMARFIGAIGTGFLVTPHLNLDLLPELRPLPFPSHDLAIVREGLRMVVAGDGTSRGTGWRGGEGVSVEVSGKTGTAEVGQGARRRKNTWFVAYAPSQAPSVAVAMVVENGEAGGSTSAPKVNAILRRVFNDR